jgi:hypothetical protein
MENEMRTLVLQLGHAWVSERHHAMIVISHDRLGGTVAATFALDKYARMINILGDG